MNNVYFFDQAGLCISLVTIDDLSLVDELCSRIGADSFIESDLNIPLQEARKVDGQLVSIPFTMPPEIKWGEVRQERNLKLISSDWTALQDAPLSNGKRTEWLAYRQELRDVTNQSDPFNITWPTEP